MLLTIVQLEPAPVTLIVPIPVDRLPIVPDWRVSVPPVWIVSIPVPLGPTDRFRAIAPAVLISVELGVVVLMFASSCCLGKVESQFPLKNQSEVNRPVQFLVVWACVETADAANRPTIVKTLIKRN